jgi:hypothetical protein
VPVGCDQDVSCGSQRNYAELAHSAVIGFFHQNCSRKCLSCERKSCHPCGNHLQVVNVEVVSIAGAINAGAATYYIKSIYNYNLHNEKPLLEARDLL